MISPEISNELRVRFNPDGSDLRRHQLRMLEMLKHVDRICTEHGIKYWLSSGTCLGAIRHGGFIPWDDDVDIEMLATDYDRLKKVVESDPNAPFTWHDATNDRNYFAAFAKLRDKKSAIIENNPWNALYNQHGIYIDVFRLYPSGSRKIDAFANWYHHRFVFGVAKRRNTLIGAMALRPCVWLMNKVITPVCQRLTAINAKGQLRHRIGSEYIKPRLMQDVEETVRMPFEDTMLPVPKNYDSYLTLLFGDYMSLPDLDKITPHTSQLRFL